MCMYFVYVFRVCVCVSVCVYASEYVSVSVSVCARVYMHVSPAATIEYSDVSTK